MYMGWVYLLKKITFSLNNFVITTNFILKMTNYLYLLIFSRVDVVLKLNLKQGDQLLTQILSVGAMQPPYKNRH